MIKMMRTIIRYIQGAYIYIKKQILDQLCYSFETSLFFRKTKNTFSELNLFPFIPDDNVSGEIYRNGICVIDISVDHIMTCNFLKL